MVHFDDAAFWQSVYRWLWGFLYFCARTVLAFVLSKDLSRSAPGSANTADEPMIGDELPFAIGAPHTVTKPLVRWSAAVLPLNAAAIRLWLVWAEAHEEDITRVDWLFMTFGSLPFVAPGVVFFAAWLVRNMPVTQHERGHGAARWILLDGILGPPCYVFWLARHLAEPSWVVLAAAPLYLAQSIVWAHFYLWSQRESYASHAVYGTPFR